MQRDAGTGRRHSARLMEKEDMPPPPRPTMNGYYGNGTVTATATATTKSAATNGSKGKQSEVKGTAGKKRKAGGLNVSRRWWVQSC
jgi:hypothetical protein